MFALPVVSSEEMEISLLFRMCDPESWCIAFWKNLGTRLFLKLLNF